jgi:predicted phosphodiesterase
METKTSNVLVISDLHAPFNHRNALRFLSDVKKEYKCDTIVSIGDLVDEYNLSRYSRDPDAMTTRQEFSKTKAVIAEFVSEFPKMICVTGNHDIRILKKLKEANIPPQMLFSTFNQLWDMPKEWKWVDRVKLHGVYYTHGFKTGPYAHMNTAKEMMTSVVMGHTHSTGAVQYMSSFDGNIFGMNVGCLIDDKQYAFNYASEMTRRPVIGCGVVLNNGKLPLFISMK